MSAPEVNADSLWHLHCCGTSSQGLDIFLVARTNWLRTLGGVVRIEW
jgi:hypothetical protein